MNARDVAQRLQPLFPALDEHDQQLSLATYRELAQGAPVHLPAENLRRMPEWPGIHYDAEQRVIGFWGLSLASTRHRLRVAGRELSHGVPGTRSFSPQCSAPQSRSSPKLSV